ncbi:TetR/AcrR family transcriptional regulator [Cohnella faecalis]|uniref:TetR/AcrR family transcriptional regulator n=1 Tax=Cohnella faecalis TaxID=2315694 RepID=UPI001F42CB27|nr:TetR/AcrR family transcriptional regulator [Cohnella faecalis]
MSQPEKKVDRRVIRSKEALKQALLKLMADKDFDAITITEIVELSNYNRGTFYTHYVNKEALLDDIIDELIRELLKSYRSPTRTRIFSELMS